MISKALSGKIIILLLAANLLMGLGRVATLPPFEGYDETAHYSRLEAEAFARPETNASFISTDVEDYYRHGPMSPRWVFSRAFNRAYHEALKSGKPPNLEAAMKEASYVDYRKFFAAPPLAKDYIKRYREQPGAQTYTPSATPNWQYQHPPLYYLLFSRALRAVAEQPLIPRLLVLRVLSYLTAFAGFAIGLFATLRHLEIRRHPAARSIAVFGAFYPFLMPVYFEEFARLGNDSLCALLFSLTWALVLWHLRRPQEKAIWVLLGLVMGYACLTKMLMVATSWGFLAFMLLQAPPKGAARENGFKRFGRRVAPALTAGAISFAVGLWSKTNDGAPGSLELDAWLHGRGFVTPGEGLPWLGILWNLKNMLTSTVYNFADLAMFNTGVAAITAVFLALTAIFVAWTTTLPRDPRQGEWLPLYPLLPLLGGLFLHGILGAIAYRVADVGVTPGRYIHVEAPALLLICGLGLCNLSMRPGGRLFIGAFLVCAFVLNICILVLRSALFTGCIWPSEGFSRLRVDLAGSACRPQAVYDHLALLGWPDVGVPCLTLAMALLGTAAVMALRKLPEEPVDV